MTYILKNKTIELHIDDPSENYNFSRFDWSGKIKKLIFKGTCVTGDEKTDAKEIPNYGRGFYNEFGINKPVGYQNLELNDWFHKIGVGLLRKEESDYFFMKKYNIKPARFSLNANSETLQIKCQSQSHNGYAYILEKEIKLLKSGFEINYTLKNTGEKSIITDEYAHNFISINKALINEDYELIFNFNIDPDTINETVNPENVVKVSNNQISFNGTPKSDFFFSNMTRGKRVKAQWKLVNKRNKICISEKGDFETNSINLWGCRHVISPELFIDINLKPDNTKKWSRTYILYNLS